MKCPACKAKMDQEIADYTTDLNGEEIVLEDVPIWVCPQCGAVEIDPEVQEALEDMLASLRRILEGIPEHRSGHNIQYSLVDAGPGCPGRITRPREEQCFGPTDPFG